MRLAPGDVEGGQAPVERGRLAELEHQRRRGPSRSARPRWVVFGLAMDEGDNQMTPRGAQAQRERCPPVFRFAHRRPSPRFDACSGPQPSQPSPLPPQRRRPAPTTSSARFDKVDIRPTTASLFIATVTMTMPPFVRHDAVFSSTYSARVFPYFFWSESGRIWIEVPRREAAPGRQRARPSTSRAAGVNESGDERKDRGARDPDRALERKDPGAGLRDEADLPHLRHHLRAPGRRGPGARRHSQVNSMTFSTEGARL